MGGAATGGGTGDSGGTSGAPVPTQWLVLWLKADEGVVIAHNGLSFSWNDLSEWRQLVVQGNDAYMPKHAAKAFGELPGVLFDGVDDHLQLVNFRADWSTGLTFFSVATLRTDPPSCGSLLWLSSQDEIDHVGALWTNERFTWSSGGSSVWTDTSLYTGEPILISVVHEQPGYAALYLGGSLKQTGSIPLPSPTAFVNSFVGRDPACGSHSGLMAELLLYARVLSSSERQQIQAYLEAKWKLVPD